MSRVSGLWWLKVTSSSKGVEEEGGGGWVSYFWSPSDGPGCRSRPDPFGIFYDILSLGILVQRWGCRFIRSSGFRPATISATITIVSRTGTIPGICRWVELQWWVSQVQGGSITLPWNPHFGVDVLASWLLALFGCSLSGIRITIVATYIYQQED